MENKLVEIIRQLDPLNHEEREALLHSLAKNYGYDFIPLAGCAYGTPFMYEDNPLYTVSVSTTENKVQAIKALRDFYRLKNNEISLKDAKDRCDTGELLFRDIESKSEAYLIGRYFAKQTDGLICIMSYHIDCKGNSTLIDSIFSDDGRFWE